MAAPTPSPSLATKAKPASVTSITGEHIKALERDNQALRRRVTELEAKHCTGGDVGVLVHKALLEAAKQAPPDQRLSAMSARIATLESELHSRSTQAEEERARHAEAQRAQVEQNMQLTRTIEELTKKEDEHKAARREVLELKEKLQTLAQQERHAREDAAREVSNASKLQEELTRSRTSGIDTLKKVHEKYKEQLDVQNSNMETLREKIAAQERQLGEAMSTMTRSEELTKQSTANNEVAESIDKVTDGLGRIGENVGKTSVGLERLNGIVERMSGVVDGIKESTNATLERSGAKVLEGVESGSTRVLEEVGKLGGRVVEGLGKTNDAIGESMAEMKENMTRILGLLEQVSGSASNGASKSDLQLLSDTMTVSEEYKVTMAALEERFTEMKQSIIRLGEEYGAIMGKDDDLVGGLSVALRNTLRASEERLQTEIRRSQEQLMRFEQEKQDFQRHQDKLVRTIEQQLDQISSLSRSKGMSDEEVRAIAAT